MKDLIVITGAPGSGKTTVANILHTHLHSPYIDFGVLRGFHLDRSWSNANKTEEQMAFDNLIFLLQNYRRYGYHNIVVTDLRDERVQQIPAYFAQTEYLIATLVLDNEAELQRRVLIPERDSGFRNYQAALAWNRAIQERPILPHEHRILNTESRPDKAVHEILNLIGESHPSTTQRNTPPEHFRK